MREVRDTFLKFLADNLPTELPVHAVRRDPNDPNSERLSSNAVNVQFLNITFDSVQATQLTSIDVIADNEFTALEAVNQVWLILSSSFYTPQLNYLTPDTPVPTGSNIFWGTKSVQFKSVYNDFYYHYTCLLPIQFTPISYTLRST